MIEASRVHEMYSADPVVDAGGVMLFVGRQSDGSPSFWIQLDGEDKPTRSYPRVIKKLLESIVLGGEFHRALRAAWKGGVF
jgi:hypothetical protein